MSVLTTVLIVFTIITLHEAAHALIAYAFGIVPESIHIGLPISPKIEFKTRNNLLVTLSPWLIAGGVVLDEDKVSDLSFVKQTAIFIAGPMLNIFVGIVSAAIFLGPLVGLEFSRSIVASSTESIKLIGSGQVPLRDISGPVGIVDFGSDMLKMDFRKGAMFFWLLINIMIGVFNLIPIPGLDGGRIATTALERVLGNSKAVVKSIRVVTAVFMLALFTLMAVVTVKDIFYLFK